MSLRRVSARSRASASLALAACALAVVLGVIAVGIVKTQNQSKDRIGRNFQARGQTFAGFVSTFLSQQALRQRSTAQRFLAGREVTAADFNKVVATFGGDAAVLLDGSGRLLSVAPAAPSLLGSKIAPRYPHLSAAVSGKTAVSGVVPSAARGASIVAVAVPYSTPQGRRVLSIGYPIAGGVLAAFVTNTVAIKPHLVVLVDAGGTIVAADPTASGETLRQRAPALAAAVATDTYGQTTVAGTESTFVAAPVPGTGWRLVIAVSEAKLFASVSGTAQRLPWIIFAVIAAVGLIALGLFARSLAAQKRLKALSNALAEAARTDVLTGLANRRSLEERMPQAWAYASRHQEPLSILMIDVDHFKQINDTYGHATGDALLNAVAECMRAVFRGSDIFGRWGGDEFLAILPGTDPEGASRAGERLSREITAVDLTEWGLSAPITLSIGWSSGIGASPQDLITEADVSLYRAKREGRGRVAGPLTSDVISTTSN